MLLWWGRVVSARSVPSRAPQSKLWSAEFPPITRRPGMESGQFGVSIASKLDERIADLDGMIATLNLSEVYQRRLQDIGTVAPSRP